MSMFVDRLVEALMQPTAHLSGSGDELVVETMRFRALLMEELRGRHQAPGGSERDTRNVETLAAWVKDGWLDDFLHGIADGLIEMGVARSQTLLDQFLHAATLSRIGARSYLSPTDQVLLDLVCRPASHGCDELDVRLMARRYAVQVGLMTRPGIGQRTICTDLGDAVRRLPAEMVLPFLVTLECLSCYGSADPWRAPRDAYHALHDAGEAVLFSDAERRKEADPRGLWRFTRLRRWVRMGLCDVMQRGAWPEGAEYAVTLSSCGRRSLHDALCTPPSDVALLCEQLHSHSRRQTISMLQPRQAALREAGSVVKMPGAASAPPRTEAEGARPRLPTLDDLLAEELPPAPARVQVATPAPPPPEPPASSDGGVDMEELLRTTLRDLMRSPHYAQIDLSIRVLEGTQRHHLVVHKERRSLRILLAEMLTTAAGALSGQPLPKLEIELGATEESLLLLLHDNGPGIPVSLRPRVFAERLPPGEPVPRYLFGALRRVLEENLQGHIEIAAPKLGGASFRLSLPRRLQEQAA